MNRGPSPHNHFRRRPFGVRTIVMSLAVCVVALSLVGDSLAWLMTQTPPVTNMFTYVDIRLTLEETTGGRYKMTPGKELAKDPKVTVLADSEDCWLFVKIDESADKALADYIEYSVADGWTALEGSAGVYYRAVDHDAESNQEFYVLKDNKVTVKGSVTKEMLEVLNEQNYPTLTLTAYAVQRDASIAQIDTAAEAWALIGTDDSSLPQM